MSFDSIFKSICREIDNVDSVLVKIKNAQNELDRFTIAYDASKKFISNLGFHNCGKSRTKSETFRKEGNQFFKKCLYWEALEYYNKSIAFAPVNSEELSTAYGNRASCLSRLEFFKEAVLDLNKALSLSLSANYKNKLLVRKEQYSLKENVNNDIKNFPFDCGEIPPLDREKSSFFDSTSNVVELSEDIYSNRKLIANDDINVGEVLIVEKPYSSIVIPKHFYTHCSNCFRRSLNLIPCSNCCTGMFCREECLDIANHVIECSYLGILSELNADRKEMLALKILIDASRQGTELEKLCTTTINHLNNEENNCQFYKSLDFKNILNLVTNSEKRNAADLFYRSIVSVILISILENNTNFFNYISENNNDKIKIFCGGLILLFMQSLPCNAHEISEYYCSNLLEIGAGAYATLSLINHSCDPNVVRHSCRNTVILRAIKPIKKGEEVIKHFL